jgi:hypothetical protein
MTDLDDNDLRFIKLMLLSNGSKAAKRIAEKIKIEQQEPGPEKPKHQPMRPSTKAYRTAPDYPPWRKE